MKHTFTVQQLARMGATAVVPYSESATIHSHNYQKFLTLMRRDAGAEVVTRAQAAVLWDLFVRRDPMPACLAEENPIPKRDGEYRLGELVAFALMQDDAADPAEIERAITKSLNDGTLVCGSRAMGGDKPLRHAWIKRDTTAAWLIERGYNLPPELRDLERLIKV